MNTPCPQPPAARLLLHGCQTRVRATLLAEWGRSMNVSPPVCVCTQLCLTLGNRIDCVAFQAPLSKGLLRQEYWKVKVEAFVAQLFRLFETPWTVACQVPLSMGFSGQEHWSGLPFPSPGIFPTQGLNLDLLHCRQILYHLSHQGSPRTLEWVPFPSPGHLPNSGDRMWVSCSSSTSGQILYH